MSNSKQKNDTPEVPSSSHFKESPIEEPKKRVSGKVIVIASVVIALVAGGGYCWYTNYLVPHNEAVARFKVAADALNKKNAALDDAISDIQKLTSSDEKPLDPSAAEVASAEVGKAQGARRDVPDMPSDTAEINAEAEKLEGAKSYDAELDALASAKTALENSIAQLKQVTAPTEQFVIERLTGLPNVTGIEAATEENDPNGMLHKAGGYTAAVFYSSDLVDRSKLYLDQGAGIVATGTEGGGCVEVYADVDAANKRNDYLSTFDGAGMMDSGSHTVLGTCVIRASYVLNASQQQTLTQSISDSLTRLA